MQRMKHCARFFGVRKPLRGLENLKTEGRAEARRGTTRNFLLHGRAKNREEGSKRSRERNAGEKTE